MKNCQSDSSAPEYLSGTDNVEEFHYQQLNWGNEGNGEDEKPSESGNENGVSLLTSSCNNLCRRSNRKLGKVSKNHVFKKGSYSGKKKIKEEKSKLFQSHTFSKQYLESFGVQEHSPNDIKGYQTGEKPFICPTCTREFSRPGNLKRHQLTHTGEKLYACDTCSKSFTRSSNLKMHLHSHNGEMPFQCPTCSQPFSQASNLKSHNLIHTGEKPFVCDTCSKSFTRSSGLRLHIRTHTGEKPYHCPNCTKTFSLLGNLKRHKLTHTGGKRYACTTCSKSFSRPSNLKLHMRCHRTEEKLFHCSTCTNVFQQASQLIFHNVVFTENILPVIAPQVQVPQT